MSKYANDYAPCLFTNYADWYDCFVDELRQEPPAAILQAAKEYFMQEASHAVRV